MKRIIIFALLAWMSAGCNLLGLTSDDDSDLFTLAAAAAVANTSTSASVTCYGASTSIASDIPSWIADNFNCATITLVTVSGTQYYQFETDNLPNHNTPYWGSGSIYYEDMPAGNTQQISNFDSQTYKLLIPVTPVAASGNRIATPAVATGIAINGVVFFGGEASPGNSLSAELSTFDSAQGHPTGGNNIYHYHAEPKYIPNYETGLVGIMADGYPVYGPKEEDGTTPSTSAATGSSGQYPALETDTYAHSHATKDFPSGTVHYHITNWDATVGIPTMPIYTYARITASNITF